MKVDLPGAHLSLADPDPPRIVLLCVSVITFLLVFAMPGDPAQALVGGRASKDSIELIRKVRLRA